MTAVFWHIASPDQPIVSLVLPPKLFYVRHGRSQAYATDDGGFISRAPDRDIREEEELKKNAAMHFSWPTRGWASCFVSAFGDQGHAERWGRRPYWSPVKVYELDTLKLPPGTLVLNAFMLCSFFGIEHQFNDNKDEYLFYQGIPGSCVGRCWDPWEDCPQVQFPPMQFQSCWATVVQEAEQTQTRNKTQMAVYRNKETHQVHGVEVKHQQSRGTKSVAQARRERRRQLEELERQKFAESNTNTLNDPDVNDLSGQMEVLDLGTNFDNRTSPNSPNTTPQSTTTAAATTTPNNPASTTTSTPLRLSASQIMKERRRKRELEELERQKSAESTINTLHDMDPDVNDLAGAGQMKVLDLETDADIHTSHTTPNTTLRTTATEATIEAGSPAAGVAAGPLRGSVSQIRAIRRAQREAEEVKRGIFESLKRG